MHHAHDLEGKGDRAAAFKAGQGDAAQVDGSVINISSIVRSNPAQMSVVYSATKSALDSITRGLSRELGPRKMRVNSINAGLTETEGVHGITGFLDGSEARQMVANTPLGRTGQPEDIAPAVVFLASDESAWITDESIRVSGGLQ